MKPLLAATLEDPTKLDYPVMLSPKFDGIRALKLNGRMVSRNLKPIRNHYVQGCLLDIQDGLDGELIVGSPTKGLVFYRTSSGIMSAGGTPDFKFYVFDIFGTNQKFLDRVSHLALLPYHVYVENVQQTIVKTVDDFLEYEDKVLKEGYEGVMVRGLYGRYKEGRATHNEQILWKFKRFTDGEAVVKDLVEGVKNLNEATKNNLGYTERSSHKDNLAPAGVIGTIIGVDIKTGEQINISPGRMEHNWRQHYWNNPKEIVGKIVKYKVFDYGKVDSPRFCTFQGFRDASDMGN